MAPDLRTVLESLAPAAAPPADRLTAVLARARRRRRRTQAALVALSAAAVTTVVVVAGLGSSGTAPKQAPVAHPADTLMVNPDQVLFSDDQLGYALFNKVCQGTEGDCTSLLYATTDGARTWHPMTLPPGMPLGTEKYEVLQASGSDLFLPWSNGDWVSTDQGSTWKPVRVGSTQSTTFVQASNSDVQLVDAARATMATLSLPQGISPSGLSAGLLPGGRVWVSSGSDFEVSPDAGHAWTKVALPAGESEIGVRYNSSGGVSVLTGRPDPSLTLVAHVVTLAGGTTALQGPGVSADCTAMLADGSLLAVGAADGLPYRLPAGTNTFVRDLAGPSGPLGCLATGDGNPLWVTGPGNQLWVSSDGRTWRSGVLPQVSPMSRSGLTPDPDTTTPQPARTAVRADLVGHGWVLVGVGDAERPTTPSVPHLVLAADGTYVGSDGCNGVAGTYETGPGTLTLHGQETTFRDCTGEDQYPFTTVTAGRMSATVQGRELTLLGSNGTTLVLETEP